MEPLAVDDDICILKHETAYTAAGESPVSVCPGDESVASHFALVTAYEDIKKRLRDTERENTLLRKRVKQLEDKLFRPEAPPSEGPQYVNKAFSAYRGIYIEKEDLQLELNKLKKEKSESERLLTEQLQARELELLQLRTEMETSQGTVMKSLNSPQDYWQVDRASTEMKIHKLQEELEKVTLENSRLLETSGEEPHGLNGPVLDQTCDANYSARERRMQQTYQALCCEVTRLHSELKHQTGLIRKLRPLLAETKQAASTVPVQCLDDFEKNTHHPVSRAAPRPPGAPPPPHAPPPLPPAGILSGPPLPDSLREDCWYNGPWPTQSCSGEALLGSDPFSVVLPPPPLNQPSLDDSSRSFPSPPKPSDAMFWEGHSAASNSSSSIGNCCPRSPPQY
ncbi:5-azacytidine-induced protein 2 isoform X1 [Notothenia coriiceps]|uniref:5-azacytidine-induced protein 2 isoform X1 n=1 Tax=Notothenia coriiceps TaxID=8208 RepID=A0A6I9MLS6_9TELE|nr:PREDICTED: 5-azacytidine-induced protein 2 isoform X1 [Notothenia coriiceps]XP_010767300.1 PREDICTED: 5-azacytidine-induced protein 2 isoform X1 [Notothenia coriiceps]